MGQLGSFGFCELLISKFLIILDLPLLYRGVGEEASNITTCFYKQKHSHDTTNSLQGARRTVSSQRCLHHLDSTNPTFDEAQNGKHPIVGISAGLRHGCKHRNLVLPTLKPSCANSDV